MSKPSSRIFQALLKIKFHNQSKFTTSISKPLYSNVKAFSTCSHSFKGFSPNGFSNSMNLRPRFASKLNFDPLGLRFTSFSNVGKSQFSQRTHFSLLRNFQLAKGFNSKSLGVCPNGVRYFSFGAKGIGKVNGKAVFNKPVKAVSSAFARYREAMALQLEGFWKRNYLFLLGTGGVVVCAVLWRIMFGIASSFIGLSEGLAKYGFLALSSAMVAFAGLYLRSRLTINPDKVYRMAMRKLNTSAGVLEVMGAPLTGTDLRAYVMSGGGLRLKNFKPTLRSKRCFLIFPIRGSDRKGLVSVEVKKKKGQYHMKLLAVNIPMASGPEQRLYLIGDEEEYKVGGGLVSELRDPVVKAMAATKEFDDLDQIEDEEDAARELEEAERKHREEVEKLEKTGQQ